MHTQVTTPMPNDSRPELPRDVILPLQGSTPESAEYHLAVSNLERAKYGFPPQPRILPRTEGMRWVS